MQTNDFGIAHRRPDGAGNAVNLTTVTDANGFYLFDDLAPGTYTVTFTPPGRYQFTAQDADGAGIAGDHNSDADPATGATAAVTLESGDAVRYVDAGLYQPVSIGDVVWVDLDGDGLQDAGEPGLAGVSVTLIGTDGAGNAVNLTTVTDANGFYLFDDLAPGTYAVIFTPPGGYQFTAQDADGAGIAGEHNSDVAPATGATAAVTSESGDAVRYVDAGLYQPVSIGDVVWHDLNADGIQDAGEPGIGSVTLTLNGFDGAGQVVTATTTSDADGAYLFQDLAPGQYTVTVDASNVDGGGALEGYLPSPTLVGTDLSVDSNPSPSGTEPAFLLSGGSDLTVDFGYFLTAAIGDRVWHDLNADGNQDAGEPGIEEATVHLLVDGAIVATTTTDADGFYEFTGLTPGVGYRVQFVMPAGFDAASPRQADNNSASGVARRLRVAGLGPERYSGCRRTGDRGGDGEALRLRRKHRGRHDHRCQRQLPVRGFAAGHVSCGVRAARRLGVYLAE